jgi:hypothetical protein
LTIAVDVVGSPFFNCQIPIEPITGKGDYVFQTRPLDDPD